MKKKLSLSFLLIASSTLINAQDHFKLSSKVELRNWTLSNKAMKSARFIDHASIELQSKSGVISKSETDANGHFEITIPSTGEFTLVINYSGQNEKKILVRTKKADANNPGSKPLIDMIGVISNKHVKGMNYLGLTESHVSDPDNKLNLVRSNIYDGEQKLIQKFCTANKLGDIALEKKNYQLAKIFYQMAIDMMEGENYPKDQIKKAEDGLKLEKGSRKKQSIKHNKVKSAITNQKTGASSAKNASSKSSVETGKSGRKTRMTLGKK